MYSLIWSAAYAISTLSSTILYTVYCRYMYIYIERTGRVPRFHSEDAKTRAAPCSVAASTPRRREQLPQRRGSVAALRSREDARRSAWQRRSVAASRHREDESSPLSGVAITESLSCIFESQNANALPSFLLSFP